MFRSSLRGLVIVTTVVALAVLTAAGVADAQEGGVDDGPLESRYALTAWSAETGASPGDVFAITEDRAGYLWLGTQTGLVRFDGFRFVVWNDDAGAPVPGPILAVAGARDGSLWAGGSAGVFRISPAGVHRVSAEAGFEGSATALIEDRGGAIWVGNRRGLFRYADGRWTRVAENEGFRGREVFSLLEDQSGQLWVGSSSGVFRRDDDGFELVDARSTDVQGFAEDGTGSMWVTDDAVILRRLGSATNATYDPGIRLPTSSFKLLHDRQGRIWVAALGGGLLHLDHAGQPGSVVQRFDYEHRMTGSTRSLYEDREGNIWVGLRGGLLRLSEAMFRSDVPLDGLTQDGVRTMAVSSDGSVWIATSHSVNRFAGGQRTTYVLPQVLTLHSDTHGVMWASTPEGLWKFSDGQFRRQPSPETINWGRVLAMTTSNTGTFWVCSSLTGVTTWDGRPASEPEAIKGAAGRPCAVAYRDRRGRIWIGFGSGGGGGAALFENGRLHIFGTEDGLAPGTAVAMTEDRTGTVWLTTAGGLNRYKDGRFLSITPRNAPVIDILPTLVEDDEGFLWVGTASGSRMVRIHPREADKLEANPAAALEYSMYDSSDGLSQSPLSWRPGVTGVRGGDARLWFATGLGMAIYDPRTRPRVLRVSAPQVEKVIADNRSLPVNADLQVPNGTSTLRIEFGAISLSAASKVRFRYMLEGLQNEWTMAGPMREAVFTDLPGGSYRFRVAAAYEGPWTESPGLPIQVAPPFYRTLWFLAMATGFVLLLVAAAWWMRLRSMRNQYALVFNERARLSREIHDTLLQSLAAVGVELETIATQLDPSQNHAIAGLRRLRRQVGHALREGRESIVDLRRDPMKRRNLVQSLTDLAETTTRNGLSTDFSVEGRFDGGSDEMHTQLFRIAQEAVVNARKHGHATEVHMTLRAEPGQVVLRVEDNGSGFVPGSSDDKAASVGEHLGLLAMRERAERLQGRLAIDSVPGRGTTIEATVPLPAH
jgi:signal transduction histidine kinase